MPAVEITQEQKAKLDKYREECKQQSNVDVEILKKMREGVFTDDPKLKEFLLCVSKKAGFQNEAGEVQQDVIVEKLGHAMSDEEKAKKLIEKCGTQEGSPAGVVFKVVKCLYDSTPNHIVIIH
ncbi:hypothetical protein NQ315_006946 [Exocentrus adspersus]|uniref:Uncharacterized protein n=1 Tax=Exocentrus adspersus TaxID=1586481 RepID=A0AAV8WCV8_9CUCU|nr:hypothetical protein NQ315_006946 [Exocentrus adspersus]